MGRTLPPSKRATSLDLRGPAGRGTGGKVSRDAGPVKGGTSVIAFVDDPTGYKWELIERKGANPEPIAQVQPASLAPSIPPCSFLDPLSANLPAPLPISLSCPVHSHARNASSPNFGGVGGAQ